MNTAISPVYIFLENRMFPFTTRLWSDPDLQPALSSSLEEPEAESSTLFEGFNLIKDSITNGDNVVCKVQSCIQGSSAYALQRADLNARHMTLPRLQ